MPVRLYDLRKEELRYKGDEKPRSVAKKITKFFAMKELLEETQDEPDSGDSGTQSMDEYSESFDYQATDTIVDLVANELDFEHQKRILTNDALDPLQNRNFSAGINFIPYIGVIKTACESAMTTWRVSCNEMKQGNVGELQRRDFYDDLMFASSGAVLELMHAHNKHKAVAAAVKMTIAGTRAVVNGPLVSTVGGAAQLVADIAADLVLISFYMKHIERANTELTRNLGPLNEIERIEAAPLLGVLVIARAESRNVIIPGHRRVVRAGKINKYWVKERESLSFERLKDLMDLTNQILDDWPIEFGNNNELSIRKSDLNAKTDSNYQTPPPDISDSSSSSSSSNSSSSSSSSRGSPPSGRTQTPVPKPQKKKKGKKPADREESESEGELSGSGSDSSPGSPRPVRERYADTVYPPDGVTMNTMFGADAYTLIREWKAQGLI